MREAIDRGWRVIGTGLSFATFGVGGVLLGLVWFPLLGLIVRDRARRTRLARRSVHHAFRLFVEWMRVLGVLDYRVEGLERLDRKGLLILANHPTLLDVVFLVSLVPEADCVVRSGLARNPFTRGPVRATDYLCNDSGAGLIEDCIASLKAGSNLIIFPEGTRTPVDGPMKLQRGAGNIAARAPCDITPVTIRCVPRSLTKGLPWWRVPPRRMQYTIRVGEDIPVAGFLEAAGGEASVAARRITDGLHRYFSSLDEPGEAFSPLAEARQQPTAG
ncbi:lysophospholipid acyltransferase family protein [Dokdonella koreensis]|uniref:1-acyl-sn-glycerol-3-phosphate acyltransferase n=1 Tax=Dokdonella koreensis DS-123 TaxID=1300342 RepID=A0A167H7W6_9GAMM|nr:lysophospholipid acyltransferase family protein [Dokdonella koreensis]ANB19366.1 1-acyl-sn-glycerol-3-phosphate acyltransferase [Dokdonella koreensis DS-123]